MAGQKRTDSKGRVLKENELQRKDGRYMYRYKDRCGAVKTVYSWKLVPTDKTPKGKRDTLSLREIEKNIQNDLNKNLDISAGKKTTLNDVFNLYIEGKSELKSSTLENYKYMYQNYVAKELGQRKISEIKYSDILKFYQSLITQKHFKPNSMEIIHTILHPVFTLAVRDDIIIKNPTDGAMAEIKKSNMWEKPKRHALTEEQQAAFIDYIASSEIYSHWLPLFTVFLGTGCRVGEIIGLRWEDIDFKGNSIHINHNLIYRKQSNGKCEMHITTPKTKAGERTIPMFQEVKRALLEEKKRQFSLGKQDFEIDGYSDFVFLNEQGYVHNPMTINRAIKRIYTAYNLEEQARAKKEHREALIIPHFSVHNLRHSFCTRLVENEFDVKILQEIMGHSDISTTLGIYAEISERKKQASFKELEGKIKIS